MPADDIPTKNLTPAFKDAPIVKELDPSHSYGKSIVDKNTGEAFIWDKTDNRWVTERVLMHCSMALHCRG